MPGEAQHIHTQRLYVDGLGSGRLRGIQRKRNTMRSADLSRPFGVLHRAGNVGGVAKQHQPRIRPQHPLQRPQVKASLRVARHALKPHAVLRHLL